MGSYVLASIVLLSAFCVIVVTVDIVGLFVPLPDVLENHSTGLFLSGVIFGKGHHGNSFIMADSLVFPQSKHRIQKEFLTVSVR